MPTESRVLQQGIDIAVEETVLDTRVLQQGVEIARTETVVESRVLQCGFDLIYLRPAILGNQAGCRMFAVV